jgi:hypothetical protein
MIITDQKLKLCKISLKCGKNKIKIEAIMTLLTKAFLEKN